CWLSLESGLLWAFIGPALAVILVSVLLSSLDVVMHNVYITKLNYTPEEDFDRSIQTDGRNLALSVLLPITGLTWIFGVFSVNGYTVIFQYLFALFNSLQGLFIFIFHCFLNRQVNYIFTSFGRSIVYCFLPILVSRHPLFRLSWIFKR
ncbi:hypothetical protein LOTGIDRAFT_106517, partial [Lottia gigantea]